MKIIDSQVHIWDYIPEKFRKGHADERHAFTYDELLREMDQTGVDGAILVPRSFNLERNDYVLEAARKHPDRFAVMGRIATVEVEGKPQLQRWKDQPGMLGVRLTFHRDVDRPLMTDGSMDWFWPEAERLNIPVMVHSPERLPVLGAIAQKYPGLRLILDHMGFARPDIDAAAAAATERVLELAPYPNIFVKISAAPCYSTAPYPYKNIQKFIRWIINSFGTERCFWGSDLTRLPATATYKGCVTMFTEQAEFLADDELVDVMGQSLASCLGWSSRC
jgi:predicted TIM-barrel fold metal-dependent hydrolase